MALSSPAASEVPADAAIEVAGGAASDDDQANAADIIVTGRIAFRNRTEDPNPVLSYDLEYFQRFEPVSVGEMLKRVPGVTFTSDVLEYDGVQMRGLPPGFTQVLINGRRAPGGEADRSFFVDRIPAELVERIEIVRAPRADQPSEGMAGTLNIVTKESASFEGGFAKAGALINQDGGVRPSGAIAYATTIGETSIWGALNYQGRRNPKKKVSDRFGDAVGRDADETDPEFDNRELQADTRDGTDISGNAEISTRIGAGRLRIAGLFVDTDRDEDETSLEYEGEDLELDGVEIQRERISQQTYALTADAAIPVGGGELGLAAGWSAFRDQTLTEVDEGDTLEEAELDEREFLDIKDDEYSATVSYTLKRDRFSAKAGIDFLDKQRDGSNIIDGEDPAAGAIFEISEKRYDPYLRLTFEPSERLSVDLGVRYEVTRRDVVSNSEEGTGTFGEASYDDETLNPSFHARFAPTKADQFRLSVARTVRRPNYDLISPYRQEESPADEDETVGNPLLKNERAWGVDVGYERRLGGKGIVGINFFYRDIKDLIELVTTGEDPLNGEPGNVYQPRNIGDGQTWGFEIDLSAPLTSLGMPDTGVFANYTYLDSKTRDPFTGENRRFNNQPHHVYNIGFIQTVRSMDASFGASLSGRSRALESNFDETVDLRYGQDLEAFVEKRFGRHIVLRLSAQNLLNRSKREIFRKFDGDSLEEVLDARANGDIDEYERERERSGRLFQVTLRAAF
ncbi:TonB-dependent receptor plug domain-containing protein [Sphingosinicella rhizophila]|uniref:TonB-dependent receptor n=1 Tax=Sphingosinicella rhizophila TaxID=3050082 RepID=A0ABU3Q406_9SPHN|nr:TonB-dependent receptor [Sphingosinicella sp. GR2756]MDT9597670.1 TonB-dependent receptor [Sphingosinicella sp. GR2756]